MRQGVSLVPYFLDDLQQAILGPDQDATSHSAAVTEGMVGECTAKFAGVEQNHLVRHFPIVHNRVHMTWTRQWPMPRKLQPHKKPNVKRFRAWRNGTGQENLIQ
jgi:hypothetical protein